MHFEQGHIYHIYNQGNNRQRVFFERDNYLFFLRKMREYLLPYCDVVAYCLMPNHLMVEVRMISSGEDTSGGATQSRTPTTPEIDPLNKSIGILLASYTRAINIQQKRSGSLFRPKTKAECLTEITGSTPSFFHTQFGAQINTHHPEEEYLQICFDYIHQNPVVAGLVKEAEEWEFSSFPDYKELRNGTLVGKGTAKRYWDCFLKR